MINFLQSIAYLEDEYSSVKEDILKSVGKEADAKTLACLKAIREDLRSNLVEYVKYLSTKNCNISFTFTSNVVYTSLNGLAPDNLCQIFPDYLMFTIGSFSNEDSLWSKVICFPRS